MECDFGILKKKLGFGCMRLPMKDGQVDTEEFSRMVDAFLENGFCYFDTAHGYVGEKSETSLRECLTSRYPRERYILTDKLSGNYFHSQEEILPLFEKQLAACGVTYFDFYLMHAQSAESFAHFKKCRAYETALALRETGRIRHFGLSFHDRAEVLDQILTEYPQIEVVQLQFNYLDFETPGIESRKCYEVCRKHGKPVIVMEPVRGGMLANLPRAAQGVLDALSGETGNAVRPSNASYALRFAAGFEGIAVVLSGMSNLEQMADNLATMQDPAPLSEAELEAVRRVSNLLHMQGNIPCTACRYCTAGCPKSIPIPELFAFLNGKQQAEKNGEPVDWEKARALEGGKPSDCIGCRRCESICPQHLEIRALLADLAKEFAAVAS